jgi:hypothetical protein
MSIVLEIQREQKDINLVIKSLQAKEHNSVTTHYYLLKRKKNRENPGLGAP